MTARAVTNDAVPEEIVDDTVLGELIDYGSVPNLDSEASRPVYDVLRLGPDPSVCTLLHHHRPH